MRPCMGAVGWLILKMCVVQTRMQPDMIHAGSARTSVLDAGREGQFLGKLCRKLIKKDDWRGFTCERVLWSFWVLAP
jgi:hypothetical protein